MDGAVEQDESPFLLLLSGFGGGSQGHACAGSGRRGGGARLESWCPEHAKLRRFARDVAPLLLSEARVRRGCQDCNGVDPRLCKTDIAVCYWLVQQRHDRLQRPAPSQTHCIDAACCLAAPLDMPSSSANFERPFHRNVYDRAIGGSLAEKFRTAQHLFVDADGPKPVPPTLAVTSWPTSRKPLRPRRYEPSTRR